MATILTKKEINTLETNNNLINTKINKNLNPAIVDLTAALKDNVGTAFKNTTQGKEFIAGMTKMVNALSKLNSDMAVLVSETKKYVEASRKKI